MPNPDELAGRSIGERIQTIRTRTGKSRAVVAGLVGRSEEWLRDVERGRQGAPGLEMLLKLGQALGVRDLTELTGDHELLVGLSRRAGHPIVPAIREAIESVDLTPAPPTIGPGELRARVDRAWRLWHTSTTPRADAGAMLPELIREGRRALRTLDGADRRTAAAALSGAYALSEQVLAWVADAPLLWLAADRCMAAAEIADDPVTLASASWVLGNVWRSTSREEDAYRLAQEAVALLEPRLDDSKEAKALWGACHLHGAITAARLGREGDALRGIDSAMAMARALPDGSAHPWTLFGVVNTEVTAVSVMVDMRRSGGALEAASVVDPDAMPSIDRRARLWLELSRAYGQQKDWLGTLGALRTATAISEESMSCHPMSRNLAAELVTHGGKIVEREARSLARRLGVTA
ncbi:helix-turn-helix domain-containing protein [Nocardia cyriacigeorgica]|uniref:helix-turn-helix domain-containing protein n=1 Tax=Nocardia cyriacigeorgica TaxID=135487 RepID=UPI001893DE01|nr:helix-turn-helix domain-containing protein [Nocardia cyriacigeorgica]MBF6099098.1 helix-turn-helix domain-containing protein [Nocardia cyriacigeorgica]MBF6159347.1 helix-turn-helix domain-containing protein [Nocardia cyriacigeorgica]MBF6198430.1 helix-turn-helix domain-containing protein [Nocardia cyriacigeorgica]MBF6315711.1 helix-turn-helix domain-containing protein [Nocardia cyriacigeorgica]MBF6530496.1 helix-turn-helix domain-containing protein [Nocardia cyriacigeorgica]